MVKVVKACLVLHNYLLRKRRDDVPVDQEDHLTGSLIPGTWREGEQMLNLQSVPRRAAQEAQQVRQEYKDYFVTEGQVPWQ